MTTGKNYRTKNDNKNRPYLSNFPFRFFSVVVVDDDENPLKSLWKQTFVFAQKN